MRLPVYLRHSFGLLATLLRYKQTRMRNMLICKFVVTPRRTQTWRGPSTQHLTSLGSLGPHPLLQVPSRDVVAWVQVCFVSKFLSTPHHSEPFLGDADTLLLPGAHCPQTEALHGTGTGRQRRFLPSLFLSLFFYFMQLETD